MASSSGVQCGDFLEFQECMKKMRVLDDKIIYALNVSIPTESFKSQVNATATCQDLYSKLQSNYVMRESAIKKCIKTASEKVETLKTEKASNPNNIQILKQLKQEQTQLRLLQSELNVEEVVKDRSLKVYYERCRMFYKPADIQL